jgi:hypothetical protein
MDAGTTTSVSTGGDTSSAPVTTLGNAAAALALADSSSADTATASEAPVTPAAATAQPGTEGQPSELGQTDAKAGEPPAWRWQDILANARTTTAKETEERVRKELESALKPFAGVDPGELAGYRVMQAALAGDPQAVARIKQNPAALSALRALVAEQQAQAADVEPEADLQSGDGTLVYSAPQLKKWQQWNANQLRSEFEKKLQPIVTEHQQTVSERALSSYKTTTGDAIAALKAQYPEFESHRADVSAVINADPTLLQLATNPETASMALKHAWQQVYLDKVLPAKQSQAEAQVVASLQQRAVAATTNPATATSATPKSTLGDARAALEHAAASLGA